VYSLDSLAIYRLLSYILVLISKTTLVMRIFYFFSITGLEGHSYVDVGLWVDV